MRKKLLLGLLFGFSLQVNAQTTSDFEHPVLPKADTSYINFSDKGKDVGFSSGNVYFPCVFDEAGGYSFWSYGFSYSNHSDTITSGISNQYAAKTGIGFGGSAQYAVVYGENNTVKLQGDDNVIEGFYITNSTYAYNTMRDGDAFSKKFTADDKDFFLLTVYGYLDGNKKSDSINYYLADFTSGDPSKSYIVNDWQWLSLRTLGRVDSVSFKLSSSDNGDWGMNTPAYFCMDNLISDKQTVSISEKQVYAVKVYPNPATSFITIEKSLDEHCSYQLVSLDGKILVSDKFTSNRIELPIAHLSNGMYFIRITSSEMNQQIPFIKQ
jgi:hypothetical protein